MANFLDGISLAGYRGIGRELQTFAPLSQINLVIGANNAGKSIVLEFLARHLLEPSGRLSIWTRTFDKDEAHQGLDVSQIIFGLAVPFDTFVERITHINPRYVQLVTAMIEAATWDEQVWLKPAHDGRSLVFMDRGGNALEVAPNAYDQEQRLVQTLWRDLTNQTGGGYEQHWLPESLMRLANLISPTLPKAVTLIPAIRQIGGRDEELVDCSGKGLIDRLAELQNPPHNERDKRETFELINRFLQEVTNTSDARIEIPHDRRHILVSMEGRILPLSYLGTGIHEVIMIASFCTLATEQVVCIEEPEIHLHPLLQKKLIAYLAENTSNQYFIATHSASFLDTANASIFHVHHQHGSTYIGLATSDTTKFQICQDLGFRASDLLQANCIIWVEGPSDRIYLRAWISTLAPQLVEGIHYSIMFYGGRLLSHLEAEDSDVTDFISLRRMNRRSFVLIDSDRKQPDSPLNATKQRVTEEFTNNFSWVTAGREIENYVSKQTLNESLSDLYEKTFAALSSYGTYDSVFLFNDMHGKEQRADKVKLAYAVTSRPIDLDHLDLRQQVETLVQFIRDSND
jgi:predicted ATP-dependent endonuclease of OLD family